MKFNIYNVKLKIDKNGMDVIIPYDKNINECLSNYFKDRTDVIKTFIRTINLKELNEMYDVGEVLLAIENEGYFSTIMKKEKKIVNEKREEIFENLKKIEQAVKYWF